jgi:hypothetical protein
MGSYFEAGMLICFGVSWPLAVIKTYRTKTVEGLSAIFLWFIFFGYVCGIVAKMFGTLDWVTWLYAMNLVLVVAELGLYYRYRGRPVESVEGAAA